MNDSILERVSRYLIGVSKPARYIGNELNIVRKDPATVHLRLVLSYPDVYEVGMSNLGIRILYEAVNSVPGFSCERVFSPWLDFETVLRRHMIPLYSLETYTPLHEFDVVGFSLGYELLYTNLLAILDLGGIPMRSEDRGEGSPLVIAGGPSAFNPEPAADFIDVFIMGDGEKSVVEFLNALVPLKDQKRAQKLAELNRLDFTYVPSLYGTRGKKGYLFTDVDKIVRRRVEPDLDALPFPRKPIVPLTRIVQERVNVEVSRGCTTGCRFCQAGFVYRPVRERSVAKIMKIVDESLSTTGYDEVSLLSLNVGAYRELETLVRLINDRFSSAKVSVSLPSLKVNNTGLGILEMISKVRKSGLTFAVESADGLVRSRLNKAVDEAQLGQIIRKVDELGWRLIKLYFMIGLPMARDEVQAIHEFVSGLTKISRRLSFNLNVSVFIPKPHTPFERERQLGVQEAEEMLSSLKKRFEGTKVRVKFQNPRMSLVEGVLSRGDRKIGSVIAEVFRRGERFSSWDEVFDYEKWESALSRCGVEPERFLSFDGSLECLPWSFVDTRVRSDFLGKELEKSRNGLLTPDCVSDRLSGSCSDCGVCKEDDAGRVHEAGFSGISGAKKLTEESPPGAGGPLGREGPLGRKGEEKEKGSVSSPSSKPSKILFVFTKMGYYRYLSHLDLLTLLARVFRIADLPMDYSQGFNPKPRIILPFPLALGIESEYELGEVFLRKILPVEEFTERVNRVLGAQASDQNLIFSDFTVKKAKNVEERKSIASKPFVHEYRVEPLDRISREHMARLERETLRNEMDAENRPHNGNVRCVTLDGTSYSLGLKGGVTVKELLMVNPDSPLNCSIRRTRIWEDRQGALADFLK